MNVAARAGILAALLCAALAPQPCARPARILTGTLKGVVEDATSGAPVGAGAVGVFQLKVGSIADAEGKVTFWMLPPGRYDLKLSCPGYELLTLRGVEIAASRTTHFTARLRKLYRWSDLMDPSTEAEYPKPPRGTDEDRNDFIPAAAESRLEGNWSLSGGTTHGATIRGRVWDEEVRPGRRSSASIAVDDSARVVAPDSANDFTLTGVSPGRRRLDLCDGPKATSLELTVWAGATFQVTLAPYPHPCPVAAVEQLKRVREDTIRAPGSSRKEDPSKFGSILVSATAEGKPIPSSSVAIPALKVGAILDSTGAYLLQNIPPGQYMVQFRAFGYEAPEARVVVHPRMQERVKFEAIPIPGRSPSEKLKVAPAGPDSVTGPGVPHRRDG